MQKNYSKYRNAGDKMNAEIIIKFKDISCFKRSIGYNLIYLRNSTEFPNKSDYRIHTCKFTLSN